MMNNYLVDASVIAYPKSASSKDVEAFNKGFSKLSRLKKDCPNVALWFSRDTIYNRKKLCPESIFSVYSISDAVLPMKEVHRLINYWFAEAQEEYRGTFEEQYSPREAPSFFYDTPSHETPYKASDDVQKKLFSKSVNMLAYINGSFGSQNFCSLVVKGGYNETLLSVENKNIAGSVIVLGINKVPVETSNAVKTIKDAVARARSDFRDCLAFDNSIESMLNISCNAGPPARIYCYLETLACVSKYLRERKNFSGLAYQYNHSLKDDAVVFAAKLFGLDCSGEGKRLQKCPEMMQRRKFGNLDSNAPVYTTHLKPSTYRRNMPGHQDYGTVRIYFDWDRTRKNKIFVKYIGGHLETPKDCRLLVNKGLRKCPHEKICEGDEAVQKLH